MPDASKKGQTSVQISLTRAPWANAASLPSQATEPLQRQASLASNCELDQQSVQAQEKAPWAGNGVSGLAAIADSTPRLLAQAPTRAPWAGLDAERGNTESGPPSLPVTAGTQLGSSSFASAGNSSVAWQNHQEPAYKPDLDVQAAMPLVDGATTVPAGRTWQRPSKRILSHLDLERWLRSDSASSYVAFLLALNEAVHGKRLCDPVPPSAPVDALVKVLETMDGWVDEIPPVTQSLRYGNPAFRTWHARATARAPELIATVLPSEFAAASKELGLYLSDSLGNAMRVDYGTGHETTFAALLYGLCVLGVFRAEDAQALVTRVFARYLLLMRRVQRTYWLEPAGSHGVWGLDDYHFLPFLWGSSQLIGNTSIRPASIHSDDVLAMNADDYLYLSAVKFVKEVKKGPLGETSPMLNDISGVPGWGKVNAGMIKMYQAEVLGKFPIMQHMLFGSLLTFPEPRNSS